MSSSESERVSEDEAGQRLDGWLKQHFPTVSYGRLQKLLRTGQVRVDGRRVKADRRLSSGEVIRVPPELRRTAEDQPERPRAQTVTPEDFSDLRARVLYRDESVLAIDKPAGLAVQGGSGQTRHLDGLLEALRFEAADPPRLVHRLDKDTSGVLLLGRSARAARALTAAFRGKAARKLYWAAVVGIPKIPGGRIDLPLIKRSAAKGEKVVVDAGEGKPATTLFHCIASHRKVASWLLLAPLTGRTHQLRVHCAEMGHPILGDGKYGGRAAFLTDQPALEAHVRRLHLHAREISIPHPDDDTTLRVSASLPKDLEESWTAMGFDKIDARAGEDLLFRQLEAETSK